MILCANVDAPRTGAVYDGLAMRLLEPASRRLPVVSSPTRIWFWSIAFLLLPIGARMAGLDAGWLDYVQLVPDPDPDRRLLRARRDRPLPRLAGRERERLRRRRGPRRRLGRSPTTRPRSLRIDVVLCGGGETTMQGFRSFVRSHRKQLDRETTRFISFESVGRRRAALRGFRAASRSACHSIPGSPSSAPRWRSPTTTTWTTSTPSRSATRARPPPSSPAPIATRRSRSPAASPAEALPARPPHAGRRPRRSRPEGGRTGGAASRSMRSGSSTATSAAPRRLRAQPDRQRLQLVDELRRRVRRPAVELDVGIALQRLLDQDPQLEPRQRGAEAEVAAAGAERLVLGVAGDVEAVGVLVARLVAVRRRRTT